MLFPALHHDLDNKLGGGGSSVHSAAAVPSIRRRWFRSFAGSRLLLSERLTNGLLMLSGLMGLLLPVGLHSHHQSCTTQTACIRRSRDSHNMCEIRVTCLGDESNLSICRRCQQAAGGGGGGGDDRSCAWWFEGCKAYAVGASSLSAGGGKCVWGGGGMNSSC